MSTQITITLTDDVYQKADQFARLANRDIASVLADTIQSSIPNISKASPDRDNPAKIEIAKSIAKYRA
jgi:predicted transcriptional regulator